ncbi:MAG: metal-dependent hydrolase, partial [Bacteroidota bacterium]
FSNDYFTIIVREDGKLQLNDLRFGTFGAEDFPKEDEYIFRFILEQGEDGKIDAHEGDRKRDGALGELIERIKGNRK